MCCATRWPWIPSMNAAFISERRAVRFIVRRTAAIRGTPSCAIFRRYCPSRCRRLNEIPKSKIQAPEKFPAPSFKRAGGVFGFRTWSFSEGGNLVLGAFSMIRVILPFHLRNLARVDGEVELEVAAPVTVSAVIDALEARYPVLRGTIRDHGTLKRRPFVRFFACKEDLSLDPPETKLPDAVVSGDEPFLIVGAMAGG